MQTLQPRKQLRSSREMMTRQFRDHAGRPVQSLWVPRPEDERPPRFSIQVYSLVPLCESFSEQVYRFFDPNGYGNVPSVDRRFDFYEPQPDLPACVEHQRREIAYRKTPRLDDNPAYPIPKYIPRPNSADRDYDGFLLVITSNTFQSDKDSEPNNPLRVYFNRKQQIFKIEDSGITERVESDGPERDLYEMNEMRFVRHDPRTGLTQQILEYIGECGSLEEDAEQDAEQDDSHLGNRSDTFRKDSLDVGYDFDIGDQGIAMDILSISEAVEFPNISAWTRFAAEDSFNLESRPISPSGSSLNGLVMSNCANRQEPTLRYLVYVNFPMTNEMNLNLVGRVFSLSVLNRLADGTSVHLEFYPSPLSTDENRRSSIQRILDDTKSQLSARPEFSIGGLQPDGTRVFLVRRACANFPDPRWKDEQHFSTFSIILDLPDFLNKTGVLFALTDAAPSIYKDVFTTTQEELTVWRSLDMNAVAKRLRFKNGVNIQDRETSYLNAKQSSRK